MQARGKLELSSSLQVTFSKVKCMIRMMYVAITRRGVKGAKPSRRWYGVGVCMVGMGEAPQTLVW